MLAEHGGVIHLVDVVAGEDRTCSAPWRDQDVEVLVHRVGGALVPELVDALLRGQEIDELVDLAAQEAPAALKMAGRLWDLYCVMTLMRRSPELMQLDSAKSMMRNLPPK